MLKSLVIPTINHLPIFPGSGTLELWAPSGGAGLLKNISTAAEIHAEISSCWGWDWIRFQLLQGFRDQDHTVNEVDVPPTLVAKVALLVQSLSWRPGRARSETPWRIFANLMCHWKIRLGYRANDQFWVISPQLRRGCQSPNKVPTKYMYIHFHYSGENPK